jgi:hypothetical protein
MTNDNNHNFPSCTLFYSTRSSGTAVNCFFFIRKRQTILVSTRAHRFVQIADSSDLLFLLFLVGWDWVHLVLRPLLAYLLYHHHMIVMVIVEQFVERRLAGETEVLEENLPQHHFVHHTIPNNRTRARTGPPWWEASD